MQRARDKLLAGAGFAGDHDREIGLHQTRQGTVNFLHGGGAPHEGHPVEVGIRRGTNTIFRLRHRAPDDRYQFPQVEGLRQIIISAALGRLDRGHEGILRAHDDDRQIRPQLFHLRQQFEGIFIRHDDIGNDEITLTRLNPSPQRCRVSGRAHFVARARQSLTEDSLDGCIIISNEDITRDHQTVPSWRRELCSYPPNLRGLRGFPHSGGSPRPWHRTLGLAALHALTVTRDKHGHQNPERRAAERGFAFYGTTMIANNLGNQSKP